jgi:hypothetical protein
MIDDPHLERLQINPEEPVETMTEGQSVAITPSDATNRQA